jgi:hypothetical protein
MKGPRYEKTIDDRYDKWLFSVAAVFGGAAILILKAVHAHPLILAALPAVILLVYTLYIINSARFSASTDRAGDNVYYLGLLFTLVSLAYALWQLRPRPYDEAEDLTFELISNFGIALSSTIFGLFFRIFIQQFRNDPVDVEHTARVELGDAVRHLRNELYMMTSDVNSYRRAVSQSLNETADEVAKLIKKASGESAKAVTAASKRLASSTDKIETIQKDQANLMNGAMEKAAASLELLSKKFGSIFVDKDVINEQILSIVENTTEAMTSIKARSYAERETTRELGDLIKVLKEISSNELRGTLIDVVGTIKDLSLQLKSVENELGGTLGKIVLTAEGTEKMINETQESLLNAARTLRAEVDRVRP